MTGSSNPYESSGTIDKWNKDYYQPVSEKYYDLIVAKMMKAMNVQPGELVLDAGCGTGVHSVRASKYGAKVTAIDISQSMIDVAKQNIEKAGFAEQTAFQQEDLTTLSFADQTFDHIFSWGVIIHIPDFKSALDNLVRALKPGGSLALYVTNENALDLKIENFIRKLLRKPDKGYQKDEWGTGFWHDMPGGKMWTTHVNAKNVIHYLENQGFSLTHHSAGETTEMQKHLSGALRTMILHLNNALYKMQYPPSMASTQLLVFKKADK